MSDNAIGQEIGNKMSAQSFGWDKTSILKAVLADQENDVFLFRVMGVASGLRKYAKPAAQVRDGEDTHGFGLSGAFVGVSSDGEEIKGSVLYLPGYVNDMVVAALSLGDDVAGVRIGFDIYARYDEKSATTYVFVARDLLNEGVAGLDDVKDIVMQLPMPSAAKALPAPKK